jgi:general secretion pathway protein I
LNKNKRLKQQGFSLLEILIAFSILAVSLGILLKIFSGGLNNAIVAEDYTVAVQIAESLVAKTGSEIQLKTFQDSGTQNNKYRWQLTISPYTVSSEKLDLTKIPAELFKINVTVAWDDGTEDERVIELNTLKLASKDHAQL